MRVVGKLVVTSYPLKFLGETPEGRDGPIVEAAGRSGSGGGGSGGGFENVLRPARRMTDGFRAGWPDLGDAVVVCGTCWLQYVWRCASQFWYYVIPER